MVLDRSGTILVDTADPARVGDAAQRVSLSARFSNPTVPLAGFFEGRIIAAVRPLTGGAVVLATPRSTVEAPVIAEARNVLFVGIQLRSSADRWPSC